MKENKYYEETIQFFLSLKMQHDSKITFSLNFEVLKLFFWSVKIRMRNETVHIKTLKMGHFLLHFFSLKYEDFYLSL